jgi:hypothetical protein
MAMPRASEARLAVGSFWATTVWSGMGVPFQFADFIPTSDFAAPASTHDKNCQRDAGATMLRLIGMWDSIKLRV